MWVYFNVSYLQNVGITKINLTKSITKSHMFNEN